MKERTGKLRKYFQHHRAYRNTSLCSIKDNSKELKWPQGLDGTTHTLLTEEFKWPHGLDGTPPPSLLTEELKWPHGLDGTLHTLLTEAATHTFLPGRYSYLTL